jgi:hypothetical protein
MKLKKIFENLANMAQSHEVDDHEATMAIADLKQLAEQANQLAHDIQAGQELEGWIQAKITKAADYIQAVHKYYHYRPEQDDSDCTGCGHTTPLSSTAVNEGKSTCCGRCGHKHVKGTSCPKPFLTGKRHCRNRS